MMDLVQHGDFKQLMQHGLVIFHDNSGTTVKKIATPTNPTEVLHNEIGQNCSIKNFPLYDTAVAFCWDFIEHGLEKANLVKCTVAVAYNPTGLALKIKNLDNIEATSHKEAIKIATEQAVAFFKDQGIVKKIGDDFEVKVYPI